MHRLVTTFFSILLLGVTTLSASDSYICDCASGSNGACVSGDDLNSGTSDLPWKSYEKARQTFGSMAAGDSLRFCRGGAWDISGAGTRWVNTSCEASNPCVVEAYVPTWGNPQTPRPILRRLDGGHGFALEDGGDAEHEEGYRFSDLEIRSTSYNGNGFFLYNDIDDVLIENVEISGFAIGVHLAGSNPCSSDPECDGQNDRIVLERATILDNEAQGWLGASNGTQILDSYFEGNGTAAVFDHNIYISGAAGGTTSGIRVVGNRLYRSALDGAGVCQAVSFVVHGQHSNMLIEGNEVWEDVGQAGQGCWGIAVDPGYGGSPEGFTGVTVRGNVVRNVGNLSIGVASCVDCLIENNVVIQNNAFGVLGIAAPDRTRGAEDLEEDRIVVRNNSIYIGSNSGGTAIRLDTEGDDHVLASNAIHYAGSSSSFNCLDVDLPISSYLDIDSNDCYHPNASGAEWADGMGTLLQWQISSGFDLLSSLGDPGFANPADDDLRPVNETAEMVGNGHSTLSSPNEIGGFPRDSSPDQGAYEWGVDGVFSNGFESGDLSGWSGTS